MQGNAGLSSRKMGEECIVSGCALVLSKFPHARVDCPVRNPGVSVADVGCPLCFCYVCDVNAAMCKLWSTHSESSGKLRSWRSVKTMRKNVRSVFTADDDHGGATQVAKDVVSAVLAAVEGRRRQSPDVEFVDAVELLDTDGKKAEEESKTKMEDEGHRTLHLDAQDSKPFNLTGIEGQIDKQKTVKGTGKEQVNTQPETTTLGDWRKVKIELKEREDSFKKN